MSANEYLLALEKSLKSKLRPIVPDETFVSRLRKSLENTPASQRQRTLAVTLLSVAAGLVVGLGIFLIGREFFQDGKDA